LNPSLAFPVIDKLLGGKGQPLSESRAVTEIEQKILEGFLKVVIDDLREAWKPMVELEMQIVGRETRPQLLQIVAPNEVVLSIVFHVQVGDAPLKDGDTIRVGEQMRHLRNVSISYVIEVPRDTEISSSVLSGAQTIQDVRGPVKAEAASGSIRVNHIEHQTQLSTLSGSIRADNIGDDIRASSASGTVTVSNIKGDVRISALSGSTQINKPGGRVEASTASGSVDVEGATSDVKAHAASGRVNVNGNPGTNSYYFAHTAEGATEISSATSGAVGVVDAATEEFVTEIPFKGGGVHSVAINAVNKHVFVPVYGKGIFVVVPGK